MIAHSKGENLPEGYVPQTILFLWDDNEIVGQFHIRPYLCESLRVGAGHIGYFIKKEFRGRGYGTKGMALTLDVARKIVPEDEIYLRVLKTNIPSFKAICNNGGYIAGEDDTHYLLRVKK